ncbi:MAG: Stp1/IreP family PP2C-type Ser/Thr phosphatase [Anaerolineae bacterium]|nr:Stp1/IreP family PP2C-type Ser/Thr phosphatase [Anaerolineae bacterium]
MTITLRAAGSKDTGKVREINEDELFFKMVLSSHEEPMGLFIVADGMGGHMGGEFASEWTVKTIGEELKGLFTPSDPRKTKKLSSEELEAMVSGRPRPTRRLGETEMQQMIRRAVERANEVVRGIAQAKPAEAADTGSTVTLAVIQGSMAYVANVGDSRTYLLHDGQLTPITRDHSVVASLVAAGQIEPEDIYTHPQRNLIYRSLGAKPEVEVDLLSKPLNPGDQLLLCSDGLWEMVRDAQITKILTAAPSPQAACQHLVQAANDHGGEDNISAVVVWIEE